MIMKATQFALLVSLLLTLILAILATLAFYHRSQQLTSHDRDLLSGPAALLAKADMLADAKELEPQRSQAMHQAREALDAVRVRELSTHGKTLFRILDLYDRQVEKIPALDTACAVSRFPFFSNIAGHAISSELAEVISRPFFHCMQRRQTLDDTISVCRSQAAWLFDDSTAPKPPTAGFCEYRVARLIPERK